MRKGKAFTLVELLTAIAIISLLASFSFSAFGKARDKAKEVVVVSDCHQIYLAMEMYAQEHGFPPSDITQLASYLRGMDLSSYEINPDGWY